MFKNYLKTTIRSLRRNKGYTFINVAGLSVSIAACLLIYLVIQFETSFDNFHRRSNRIYRVATVFHNMEGRNFGRGTSFPVANGLRTEFPQLEKVARINASMGEQITVMEDGKKSAGKKFNEQGLFFAEPEFFEIFNFPFLAGDPATALSAPYTAVLTQQAAEKYFGDWKQAMGKFILF